MLVLSINFGIVRILSEMSLMLYLVAKSTLGSLVALLHTLIEKNPSLLSPFARLSHLCFNLFSLMLVVRYMF